MSTVLKKITAEAKRIRKASPRMTWQAAIKKAGAKYRASAKKSPAKKAAGKRKVATKKTATRKRKVAGYDSAFAPNQMIAGVKKVSIAQMKTSVLTEIGKLEARKFAAKLKRDKTAIAKKIAEKKSLYRKLS